MIHHEKILSRHRTVARIGVVLCDATDETHNKVSFREELFVVDNDENGYVISYVSCRVPENAINRCDSFVDGFISSIKYLIPL